MNDLDPAGTSIFCDDIRYEAGNKFSYMGVYQGAMYVPSFPITLPKFCAVVTLRRPRDQSTGAVSFRLKIDELELAHVEVEGSKPDADAPFRFDTAFFQIAPFRIESACVLKSRIYVGDQEVRAGLLRIGLPTPG